LGIHAYGELGETEPEEAHSAFEEARTWYERVKENRLPLLVELRDELAARYVRREPGHKRRPDDWVFDKECQLLLLAA
jgi:hypothetical protein